MQQEIKDLLDKNSDRFLSRISPEENSQVKKAISTFVSEISALSNQQQSHDLMNARFGASKNTVLHLAAKFGDESDVKKLLAIAALQYVDSRNEDFLTPLHLATINGHLPVVLSLLAAGAEKNPQASEKKRKWTPIHYAAQNNHIKIVEALIRAGVGKETETGFGLTPLVVAAEFGHLEIVKYMLELGAEKNVQTAPDNHRMTALHYAVIGNFAEVAVTLLDAKVDKEKQTDFGLTALEFAARNNLVDMVLLLMKYGADRWDSALKIAQETKSNEVVMQIKKYQKAKAALFNVNSLNKMLPNLVTAMKQFNATNLSEGKIVLEDGVVFNAYGIVTLKHQLGLFKKVTKNLAEFVDENAISELGAHLKRLTVMAS